MCIKHVGIINKVAWNIRNYRYVGDVSVTDKYSLLVPWYVISYEPFICLQANQMTFHREGPEYIYSSSGWTNPTIDPYASTHTFQILNPTFITTHLRSGA